MMKRILVTATLATSIAALTVMACGGSSSNNGGGGSSSSGSSSGTSSGTASSSSGASSSSSGGSADGGGGTQGNPPLPDGSVLPHGNQLVPSPTGSIALNGVTTDDYAIYTDTSANTNAVWAVSLAAGSTPISLGTADDNDDVVVLGKVVLIGTTETQGVGAMSAWTSGASAPASVATSTFLGQGSPYGVSSDGAHVIFLEGVNAAGTSGGIAIAGSDGTGKTTVVDSIDLADGVCFPQLGFGGTTAVAAYCENPDGGQLDAGGLADGGDNLYLGTVASFSGASWTMAPIASGVQAAYSVDTGGTKVAVNGPGGTSVYPIGGGTAVPIDATGALGAVTYTAGLFTTGATHLAYVTNGAALELASTSAPASPVALSAAGTFTDLFTLSPDGNWLVGSKTQVQQNNGGALTDLYLASTTVTTATAPTALDSTADTSPFNGDLFTADSTHVVYQSAIGQSGGTLHAMPVAGGTATTLGTNAIGDLATSAAKIVFNSNTVSTSVSTYADLQGVDTSQTAAPAVLVSAADPVFGLNNAKTTIVYTWSYDTDGGAGLWTLPAP